MSEAETDTTELTAHEFRAQLPCEHSGHNAPVALGGFSGHTGEQAVWDYRFACPCGSRAHAAVCEGFRLLAKTLAINCSECHTRYPGGDGVATFDPIPEATP